MANNRKLTEKQLRFVEEYLGCYNASEACRRAGYSHKTAHVQGHDLLRNPKIQEEISRKQEEISRRLDISKEGLLKELQYLLAQAQLKGATTNALEIIKQIAKMTGHDGVTQIDITSGGKTFNFNYIIPKEDDKKE